MILLIITLILILVVYKLYSIDCDKYEHLDNIAGINTLNNEAACNIASVYNNGKLTVTDLVVTGNASITGNTTVGGTLGITGATKLGNTLGVVGATTLGSTLDVTDAVTARSAKIGNWHIINDNIGIDGKSDINMQNDYIRIYQNEIVNGVGTQTTTYGTGLAAGSMWSQSGGNIVTTDAAYAIQSNNGSKILKAGGWSNCINPSQGAGENMRFIKVNATPNGARTNTSNC